MYVYVLYLYNCKQLFKHFHSIPLNSIVWKVTQVQTSLVNPFKKQQVVILSCPSETGSAGLFLKHLAIPS